jgi:PPOX class probable F420-dependent enzyme
MSTESTKLPIPESHHDLIARPLLAHLATTLPDGTPQVTPVWFDYEDGHFFFNTAVGRLKDKAIRKNPYIAFTVIDPVDGFYYLAVRGPVVEISEEHGRAHIDRLARRYTGAEKYTFGPPEEARVRYKVAPEHVLAFGR